MAQWQALEDEVNRLFGNGRPVLDVVALDVNEVRTAAVGSEISIEEAYEIMEYFEAKLSRTANTQCHRLDMSHRAVSKAAREVLDPVLVKISRTVNILVLGIVSGEPDEQELALQHLARLFSQANHLHSVECRKINFGAIPSGVKCLVPLLEKTSVKKWVFYQANLTESCALWLRYSLHRSIQTLHITESNDIGCQGAAYIGQLVSQCSDLSSFSYCRNGQDVEISAAIGEGLYNALDLCKAAGTTTRLASLDFSDIVIPHPTDSTGYKGAQLNVLHILCSTLRGLPSLSSFTMRNAILGGSPLERMQSLSAIFRALFLDSHARLYRLD
jgi:hypothetical protein